MKYFIFLTLMFIAIGVSAQDTSSVVVHKDPRIDLLLKKTG